MRRALAALCAAASISSGAPAGDFSIKGFELGKSAEDFYAFLDCEYRKDGLVTCKKREEPITVGGEVLTSVFVEFNELKQSVGVYLGFKSEAYAGIKSAVVAKYPKTKCKKAELATKAGARIPTEICSGSSKAEILTVQMHATTTDRGALTLLSSEALAKAAKAARIKQSDI